MAAYVERAIKGPKVDLPDGFCFLVLEDSQAIVEPALLFLVNRFLKAPSYRPNTQKAYTDDLKDWWDYLDYRDNLAWDEVDEEDLKEYRGVMQKTISPRTHRVYDPKTIRRRVGTVAAFYQWAHRNGLVDSRLEHIESTGRYVPHDRNPNAHVSSAVLKKSSLLPKDGSSPDDDVRPLSAKNVELIMRQLGPLPSERLTDLRPSRDRLAAEISLNAGLRVDEVATLNCLQIENLEPDVDKPYGICRAHLVHTKGLTPRWIELPNWLVLEVKVYIKEERAEAIRFARRYWCHSKSDEPKALFVNIVEAKQNVGRAVAAPTFSRNFSSAQKRCGMTVKARRTDPTHGQDYVVSEPRHVFHHLRHTFAIWLYYAEFRAGNPAPWKRVQALLGHKYLHTTLDTYLRVAGSYEVEVSATLYRAFQEMRDGAR